MIYRKNQKNSGNLSQLGFGCMRFPRKGLNIDIARSAEMVHSAIERGVNYFDTAYIYPGSEEALGKILSDGWREKINLATKMPLFLVRSAADFDKFFTEQLKRLKTEHIDYYMLHMLTDLNYFDKLRILGIEDWINKEKLSGRIRNIGFSFHGRSDEFIKIIDAYDWEFCMIQYNYLDEHYQAGTAGLKYAYEKNIPVIAMEPLRGGKLAAGLPQAALGEFSAADKARTPAGWALRWLWNLAEITVVLSGMSSPEQVNENITAAAESQIGMLTKEELKTVENVKNIMLANIKVHCTGCGYCMPCPAGVDIPTAFGAYNEGAISGKLKTRMNYLMMAGIVAKSPQFASQCIKCGKCEPLCPQNIEIMRELAGAKKYLEPIWAKPAAKIAKKFTIGGVKTNK